MARGSSEDPIEKFRFRITVISFDVASISDTGVELNLQSTLETIAGLSDSNTAFRQSIGVISRAGFQSCDLPKVNIGEIAYRENIDNQRSIKVPGLVKYDPITLSRGVTKNRDLYDWYRLVNEEIALLSVANELTKDVKFSPTQSDKFRKDIVIECLDRKGNPIKGWYLFNAWPTVYTPGNGLAANSEEKLIESITLTYEFFLELEGGLEGFAKEVLKGVGIIAAGRVLDKFDI